MLWGLVCSNLPALQKAYRYCPGPGPIVPDQNAVLNVASRLLDEVWFLLDEVRILWMVNSIVDYRRIGRSGFRLECASENKTRS